MLNRKFGFALTLSLMAIAGAAESGYAVEPGEDGGAYEEPCEPKIVTVWAGYEGKGSGEIWYRVEKARIKYVKYNTCNSEKIKVVDENGYLTTISLVSIFDPSAESVAEAVRNAHNIQVSDCDWGEGGAMCDDVEVIEVKSNDSTDNSSAGRTRGADEKAEARKPKI